MLKNVPSPTPRQLQNRRGKTETPGLPIACLGDVRHHLMRGKGGGGEATETPDLAKGLQNARQRKKARRRERPGADRTKG